MSPKSQKINYKKRLFSPQHKSSTKDNINSVNSVSSLNTGANKSSYDKYFDF